MNKISPEEGVKKRNQWGQLKIWQNEIFNLTESDHKWNGIRIKASLHLIMTHSLRTKQFLRPSEANTVRISEVGTQKSG